MSLVAHYKMDDAAGQTTVLDSAGSKNGTAANNIVSVRGKVGRAIDFNATTDLVNCGLGVPLDNIFDGGGTVAWWQRSDGIGENNAGRAIGKTQWHASMVTNTSTMQFFQGFGTVNGTWTFAVVSGKLQHIAIVYDNSNKDNLPIVYVDGALVSITETGNPTASDATSDGGNQLILGNNTTSATRTWDGVLDDMRLYDEMLTQNEIRAVISQGDVLRARYATGISSFLQWFRGRY